MVVRDSLHTEKPRLREGESKGHNQGYSTSMTPTLIFYTENVESISYAYFKRYL